MHGMIDLETLGVKPNSAILTVGAIKFNPFTDDEPHDGLYLRINVDDQTEIGRTIDQGTLNWWAKQKASIRDEALGDEDRVDLSDFTKRLNKWCVGLDYLWAQGPMFDFGMLENLYEQLGQPVPWNFWQIRDSRTLFAMMPKDPRKAIQSDAHNALADSYYQAKCVQQTYKHFNIKR